MNRPLSITGMGCLSAAGSGVEQTRQTFFEGRNFQDSLLAVTDDPYFKLKLREDWPLAQELSSPGLRPNLFALIAVHEAISSAGLTPDDFKKLRIGICLGSTVGGTNYQEEFSKAYFLGKFPRVEPLVEYFTSNSAQFLSRYFGLRGPMLMINNACTSGADAIGIGASWLDADLCDLVICGGTETILPKIYFGFRSLMLCSAELCRPFDRTRNGLTLGEGAGIVILEKSETKRKPKAFMMGYGTGSDSFHPTAPHPEARGLALAVKTALSRPNLKLEDIDFVNAHATATPHNDLAEGRWIAKNLSRTRVVATKGYTGHTLGAAGGIEAVFTALSLIDGKLPGSKGFSEIDPEIGFKPTEAPETGDFKIALSLSLGFGGTNSVLCLGSAK